MEDFLKDLRKIIGGLSESKNKTIETIEYLLSSKYTKTPDGSGRVWPDVNTKDSEYHINRDINKNKIIEAANHVKRLNEGYTVIDQYTSKEVKYPPVPSSHSTPSSTPTSTSYGTNSNNQDDFE